MKVIIPKLAEYSLMSVGNVTKQRNALKIYAALYMKYKGKNKNSDGFFPVPSTYLESINKRYSSIIKRLIEDGVIEYYKFVKDDPELFDLDKKKITKGYNKQAGLCMKYRFLIDVNKGKEVDVDMESNRQKNWWKITYNTLQSLGYLNININRDDFGRRVHHNLTHTYKEELKDKGLSVIDAKCSQPRLLYILMKKRGIIDPSYFEIFENGQDFYNVCIEKLNEQDRKSAKDLFMYWLNSDGYVPNYDIHKYFPIASEFLKTLKNNHYKDSSAFFQREEAKIWIDDLLNNLPVSFGLTIHDSLIVKDRDVMKVLKYCKERQPELEFDVREL